MKTLLFIPEDCEPEYIKSVVEQVLVEQVLPKAILVCNSGDLPPKDDLVQNYGCVIGWVWGRSLRNGGIGMGVDSGLDLLLLTASLRKITIGIGFSLDRVTKMKLENAGVSAYVSQSRYQTFESALKNTIRECISKPSQADTRFVNVFSEAGIKHGEVIGYFQGINDPSAHKLAKFFYEEIVKQASQSNDIDVASAILSARKGMLSKNHGDWLASCFSIVCLGSTPNIGEKVGE